jgi:hypothetical protein
VTTAGGWTVSFTITRNMYCFALISTLDLAIDIAQHGNLLFRRFQNRLHEASWNLSLSQLLQNVFQKVKSQPVASVTQIICTQPNGSSRSNFIFGADDLVDWLDV